jgi:hypothetical protein
MTDANAEETDRTWMLENRRGVSAIATDCCVHPPWSALRTAFEEADIADSALMRRIAEAELAGQPTSLLQLCRAGASDTYGIVHSLCVPQGTAETLMHSKRPVEETLAPVERAPKRMRGNGSAEAVERDKNWMFEHRCGPSAMAFDFCLNPPWSALRSAFGHEKYDCEQVALMQRVEEAMRTGRKTNLLELSLVGKTSDSDQSIIEKVCDPHGVLVIMQAKAKTIRHNIPNPYSF